MAIAFRAVGTTKKNTGSGNMASVALPTGHTTNDILVCYVIAADNVSCSMSAGWARKLATNSGTRCRQEVWWKRDSGSESAPTVTHTSGNSALAFIAAYSGVDSGLADPFRDAQTQTGNAPHHQFRTRGHARQGQHRANQGTDRQQLINVFRLVQHQHF